MFLSCFIFLDSACGFILRLFHSLAFSEDDRAHLSFRKRKFSGGSERFKGIVGVSLAIRLALDDHARNDLAGAGAESWKSQLEAAGIGCIPELRGLGEYPAVASLLADAPFLPAESWNRNAEEKQ